MKLFPDTSIEKDAKGRWYVLSEIYVISPGFDKKSEAEAWLKRVNGDGEDNE